MLVRDRINFKGELIEREIISEQVADIKLLPYILAKGIKDENDENQD